jgi:hypothetical protein
MLILSQLPAVRNFQTTAVTRDIDSAAKFIGAGAATVGVAGSGMHNVLHDVVLKEREVMSVSQSVMPENNHSR